MNDRIIVMEKDATDQLLQNLGKTCMFSIRLDESADVISAACLTIIARFPSGDIRKE